MVVCLLIWHRSRTRSLADNEPSVPGFTRKSKRDYKAKISRFLIVFPKRIFLKCKYYLFLQQATLQEVTMFVLIL